MRSPKGILVAALVAVSLVAAACGGGTQAPAKPAAQPTQKPAAQPAQKPTEKAPAAAPAKKDWGVASIQIPAGGQGGGFYALATALAPVWERELGIPVMVSTSKGSTENITLMESGAVPVSMVTGSMLYEAWAGMGQFKQQYRRGRLMFAFYPSYVFFYTRADSPLKSVKDFKGKRIGIGATSSVWDYFIQPLLEAHGYDFKNDIKRVYAEYSDMATQVGDGTLDAAMGLETTPAPYQLAEERGVRILPMDPAAVDKAAKDTWYYFKGDIKPKNLPKGWTGGDYTTVGWMGPYMEARQDLSDDLVYAMTKSFHTNWKDLNSSVNLYRWLLDDPKIATMPLRDMDWHPGAVKYWKEVGLWPGK